MKEDVCLFLSEEMADFFFVCRERFVLVSLGFTIVRAGGYKITK